MNTEGNESNRQMVCLHYTAVEYIYFSFMEAQPRDPMKGAVCGLRLCLLALHKHKQLKVHRKASLRSALCNNIQNIWEEQITKSAQNC